MLQQRFRRSVHGQWKLPLPARRVDESGHALEVESGEIRIHAPCSVKRPPADQLGGFQVLHQGRIQFRQQVFGRVEALADQPGLSLDDQRLHFRMSGAGLCPLHEDQTLLRERGRIIKLTLRRRNPFLVLTSIIAAEQPYVDLTTFHFVQIERVRTTVLGGNVLEQKHFEEPTHQRIAPQIVAQHRSLLRELRLHATDEDAERDHVKTCLSPRLKQFPTDLDSSNEISVHDDKKNGADRISEERNYTLLSAGLPLTDRGHLSACLLELVS